MGRKDEYIVTPADFSDDDLLVIRDKTLELHDSIIEKWANELAEVCGGKDFDEYSIRNKHKVNKITTKYSKELADVEISLEMIQEELDKRESYNEQQRYIVGGNYKPSNISDEEFLKREQEKTAKIREILKDNYIDED